MNPHHNHVSYSFIPENPYFSGQREKHRKSKMFFLLAVHIFFAVFFNFFFEELSLPSVF